MKDLVRRAVANHVARKSSSKDYTYLAHCVWSSFDTRYKHGPSRNEDLEIMFIEGEQYMHALKRDGQPLSPEQARRETAVMEAVAKARREGKDMGGGLASMDTFFELPFDQLAVEFYLHAKGRQHLDGHEVQVIEASPKDTRETAGNDQEQVRHFVFKLWIDSTEAQIVKLHGTVIQELAWMPYRISIPIGSEVPELVESGKTRVLYKPGTTLRFEWTKLPDGAWLPKHTHVKAPQRRWTNFPDESSSQPWLDVRDWTYTDYKKFRVTSRIVP